MTAPTRTRTRSTAPAERKSKGRAAREGEHVGVGQRGRGGTRSSAAERAYARRAQRADQQRRTIGNSAHGSAGASRGRFRPRMPRSRASFVLLIMAMLATGVIATLWLTTQAIAGSYKLERLHEQNGALAEHVAKLERVVTKRESATWLAKQARQLGMVPGGTPAKLVVHPDGSVTVVGEPHKVKAPAPPPPPPPPPSSSAGEPGQAQSQSPPAEEAPPDEQRPPREGSGQDTQAASQGG